MIKSILVDFDGTLVNSEYANYLAYKQAIINTGLKSNFLPQHFNIQGEHWSIFLPKLLGNSYTHSLGEKIANNKKLIYKDFIHHISKNNELIYCLKLFQDSVNLVLVTNASKDNVELVLNYFNIANLFKFIVTPTDKIRPKPKPDLFLNALLLLNNDPSECIVFEDSLIGIEAAKLANLRVKQIFFSSVS